MGKNKPVTLDIKDVLSHLGLDAQQFLLWSETQSKKNLLPNHVNTQAIKPSQK